MKPKTSEGPGNYFHVRELFN